jgi:hypothetical protein
MVFGCSPPTRTANSQVVGGRVRPAESRSRSDARPSRRCWWARGVASPRTMQTRPPKTTPEAKQEIRDMGLGRLQWCASLPLDHSPMSMTIRRLKDTTRYTAVATCCEHQIRTEGCNQMSSSTKMFGSMNALAPVSVRRARLKRSRLSLVAAGLTHLPLIGLAACTGSTTASILHPDLPTQTQGTFPKNLVEEPSPDASPSRCGRGHCL